MGQVITAALCTLGVVGATFAQDEKRLPTARGVGASYIQILEMTEVQDDLNLSDDDMANIPLLKEEVTEGDMKFGESLRGVAPEEMQEKLNARQAEVDKQFKEVLGDGYTRFRQIRFQLRGLFASVTREKEVQDALSITGDQLAKLDEEMGGESGGFRTNLGNEPPSPEKMSELMEALQKKREEALEKIMTAEQKNKWDDSIGTKITYKRLQMQFDLELGRSLLDGSGGPGHNGGGEKRERSSARRRAR